MVKLGGSDFVNCAIPLAFEGRYFIIEPGNPPLITVVREYQGSATFEVLRNEPFNNPLSRVTKTAEGIITVSDKQSGRFLYKVRPQSETTVVFGKIGGGQISVTIGDKRIKVGNNIIESCNVKNFDVGVSVDSEGHAGIGGPAPPALLKLLGKG